MGYDLNFECVWDQVVKRQGADTNKSGGRHYGPPFARSATRTVAWRDVKTTQ
jgi:hypothetical protein